MVFPFKAIMLIISMAVVIFSPSLPLQPDHQVRLYLQNVPLQDEKLLVINVLLADVVDLYGAEVQLRYDPTQLKARDENPRLEGIQIAPGSLLAFDDRFVARNMVDTESGLINFVFTFLNPAPPASGEGVLATVVFEISDDGPYSIEVVKAQLVSPKSEALPVVTENLYLNGNLEPTPAPQNITFGPSTQLWWAIVAPLGLFIILVFLLLLRLKSTVALTPAAVPTSLRRIASHATRSSTHSATLLTSQGNCALNQNNTEQAYELFSQAIELNPANAQAWLGKGLVSQHDTEKRICFQRALALEPDNVKAKLELEQLEKTK